MATLRCPTCESTDTHVIASHPAKDASRVRRSWRCRHCQTPFFSDETTAPVISVRKSNGSFERFQRENLRTGIERSMRELPNASVARINYLVEEASHAISTEIRQHLDKRSDDEGAPAFVDSWAVAKVVMELLEKESLLAYLRFCVHWDNFEDERGDEWVQSQLSFLRSHIGERLKKRQAEAEARDRQQERSVASDRRGRDSEADGVRKTPRRRRRSSSNGG